MTLAWCTKPGRKIKFLPNFLQNQKAQSFEHLCKMRHDTSSLLEMSEGGWKDNRTVEKDVSNLAKRCYSIMSEGVLKNDLHKLQVSSVAKL